MLWQRNELFEIAVAAYVAKPGCGAVLFALQTVYVNSGFAHHAADSGSSSPCRALIKCAAGFCKLSWDPRMGIIDRELRLINN